MIVCGLTSVRRCSTGVTSSDPQPSSQLAPNFAIDCRRNRLWHCAPHTQSRGVHTSSNSCSVEAKTHEGRGGRFRTATFLAVTSCRSASHAESPERGGTRLATRAFGHSARKARFRCETHLVAFSVGARSVRRALHAVPLPDTNGPLLAFSALQETVAEDTATETIINNHKRGSSCTRTGTSRKGFQHRRDCWSEQTMACVLAYCRCIARRLEARPAQRNKALPGAGTFVRRPVSKTILCWVACSSWHGSSTGQHKPTRLLPDCR